MPSVNLSPLGPKPQFLLSSGLPAVGAQLFFYVAGSVGTKQNTYTDSTGTVANANPIVLNALGEPSTEIWLQSGIAYKIVYAPVGDTDPPASAVWSVDNIRGINDTTTTVSEWVASGVTPTYVSATQFTMPGDQTSDFQVGRRLRSTITAGTGYHTITAASFGAGITTVTVNGTSLDSGLSAVSYGILSADNASSPGSAWIVPVFAAGNFTANGTMTWTLAAGDVNTFEYRLVGKTMTLAFDLVTTTVGGVLANELRITIPAGKTVAKNMWNPVFLSDNGTRATGVAVASAGVTYIAISRTDAANFAAAADTTQVRGQITFEIQ